MKKKVLEKILKNLFVIRKTEELISSQYKFNKFRCPVHLSIGQEAISAPLDIVFKRQDLAVSSHRAHAHYIGKGCSIENLFAEILGLDGCSGGVGGSMHLTDKSKGFICSTAIVGNSIPIGVGLALSQKLEKSKNITLIFFGEGATEQGVFYESVNFAALKKLPSLFICEDNKYSVYTGLQDRQPRKRKIIKIIENMGIKAIETDGNDILNVIKVYKQAKDYILKNKKPYFIKFNTYRYLEHCGPDDDNFLNYRPNYEVKYWKQKCPLKIYENFLIKKKFFNKQEINKIDKAVEKKVLKKFTKSKKFKKPSFGKLKKILYYEKSY